MKLGDVVKALVIDPRKLTEYALNPDNPVGRDKAFMFAERLGYTRNNYEALMEQIRALAMDAEAIATEVNSYGQRYRVDLEIVGVENQRETVRTGWIVEPGADVARLVTLYVKKQR